MKRELFLHPANVKVPHKSISNSKHSHQAYQTPNLMIVRALLWILAVARGDQPWDSPENARDCVGGPHRLPLTIVLVGPIVFLAISLMRHVVICL